MTPVIDWPDLPALQQPAWPAADELAAAQGGQHRLRRPHRHHPGDFAVLIRGAEFAAGEEIVVIER